MKVAIYCRVSTESQYLKGVSINDQKQRGIEFCKEHNYEYEIFEEVATSATKPLDERPKLLELFHRTERKKTKIKGVYEPPEFEAVYIVDIDRLSRAEEQLHIIKQHFISNCITIFNKGQKINLL
jgi:site-specific DNA recombinase